MASSIQLAGGAICVVNEHHDVIADRVYGAKAAQANGAPPTMIRLTYTDGAACIIAPEHVAVIRSLD